MTTPGGWIQTQSGRMFFPADPRIEDVCIEDIGSALSMICRFNGHTREFYSVAEHSVHVSGICEAEGREAALWGLLHDAAEAYLGDVTSPLKRAPWMAGYQMHEAELQRRIWEHFGLTGPVPPIVREADRRMLVTEMRELLPEPAWWSQLGIQPYSFSIRPKPPAAVKDIFLTRFRTLTAEREQQA